MRVKNVAHNNLSLLYLYLLARAFIMANTIVMAEQYFGPKHNKWNFVKLLQIDDIMKM